MLGSILDRRGNPRIQKPLEALCRGQKETFHRARVCDISDHGARLIIRDEARQGCLLSLNLKLEHRMVAVEARVVWSKPSWRPGETEVGVSLRPGSNSARRSIEGWVYRQTLLQTLARSAV